MGIDDITNKAKEAVDSVKEKIGDQDENIDKAADAVKGVAPESVHGHVDAVADKAKEAL